MEPANLNNAGDEPVERWLRSTNQPPIADDGFTARVLAELPPPTQCTNTARYGTTRTIAMLVGAMAGAVIIWTKGVLSAAGIDELARAWSQLNDPLVAVALYAAAAVLLYLYIPRLRKLWT